MWVSALLGVSGANGKGKRTRKQDTQHVGKRVVRVRWEDEKCAARSSRVREKPGYYFQSRTNEEKISGRIYYKEPMREGLWTPNGL